MQARAYRFEMEETGSLPWVLVQELALSLAQAWAYGSQDVGRNAFLELGRPA